MAKIVSEISRTFKEFLLLPGLTGAEHIPANVSLKTPIAKYKKSETPRLQLNAPLVSAAMQAVSGENLAVSLARKGGAAFIFCSQSIEEQAAMIRKVKEHKAGFVQSDSNLAPDATLQDAINLRDQTGHSTMAITEGGQRNGKLLGLITDKDYWEFHDDLSLPVTDFYTPMSDLVYGEEGITLKEATIKLWQNKKECLPIIDSNGNLKALVFRKDYYDHKSNPDELTDADKRLFVGAALNTFDYMERATALIEAGVDCLCFDSSDGYTAWQKKGVEDLRAKFGDDLVIGCGNVVTKEGFDYLVKEVGADFVKVGIGGGSICITRSQKGIGRGQASAVEEVANARDEYYAETGIYVPICSDGGLSTDTDIMMALAFGADFVMMGRYFAMAAESPTPKITYRGVAYKPYWGEGSNRARNWQRYKQSAGKKLVFEEGVDAYVPYSGPLAEKMSVTTAKLKSTMCNLGVLNIKELHENATITRVSEMTLVESGTSSVENLDRIDNSFDS